MGAAVGSTDGVTVVGLSVGLLVGWTVGDHVSPSIVGFLVTGADVGATVVGASVLGAEVVGPNVGPSVGSTVGAHVAPDIVGGFVTGAPVGATVVGASVVGAAVGACLEPSSVHGDEAPPQHVLLYASQWQRPSRQVTQLLCVWHGTTAGATVGAALAHRPLHGARTLR